MLNLASLDSGVFDLASSNMAVPVIWAYQSEYRPESPYATLHWTTPLTKIAGDQLTQDALGNTIVKGVRECILSVNAFGLGAAQLLATLMTRLEWPSVHERLATYGLVYVWNSDIRDLTQLMTTKYETRCQMDVRFRAFDSSTDPDTDAIDSVGITNEMTAATEVIGPA